MLHAGRTRAMASTEDLQIDLIFIIVLSNPSLTLRLRSSSLHWYVRPGWVLSAPPASASASWHRRDRRRLHYSCPASAMGQEQRVSLEDLHSRNVPGHVR